MKSKTISLRQTLFGLVMIFTLNLAQSQSYIGFLEDNYSGVHGIITNPANIADSRLKMDINLVGISALYGNDYIGFNLSDAFSNYSNVFDEAKTYPSTKNFLAFNIDVMGPSVMLSINEKSSLAIFTRGRGVFNLNEANGNLLEKEGGFDENEDFSIVEEDIYGSFTAWGEIGATYARVLLNDEEHFLKGGLTGKILQGLGNVYIEGSNISVDYDSNTREVTTTGELHLGDTGDINEQGNVGNALDFDNGFGIATDIGFVYEWRPNNSRYTKMKSDGSSITNRGANKYKLKLGVSLTDVGKLLNVKGTDRLYDLNRTQDIDNFDGDVLEEALLDNFNQISSAQSNDYVLPTALHTNADLNLTSKFYLNLNADISRTSKTKKNTGHILNQYRLTPRYESKWLAFYSPFSIMSGVGFQWGAGFRLGPLYMGSGSVISSLIGNNTKALDLFAGIKIPIYQSKLKDKDNDGIINKEDNCPDVAGPVENQGCPWKDTDEDGVLDKDDDCIDVTGPAENNGCPWKDSDGDGVLDKDDECPQTAGLAKFNGCPDTDGDGIKDANDRCPNTPGSPEYKGCPDTDGDTLPDLDDQCPNVAGSIENNGCPEVTQEVQKQLNDYARTILFDTGKATIKTESVSVMVDIIQILNEYPNAKFIVEGHTDSVGSSESNQRLSEARANSVLNFLINEGISSSRLTAIGFGEEKPITSNATKAGRQQNRRVEINLIK
jgi:outer membrane protein OmpA-like peptidoglycan-associated protein